MRKAPPKTAFVFAGGGSLGAVQVGMLRALLKAGERPDLVVGSSVGALNAGFFAGDPTPAGVEALADVWKSLSRRDIFPVTLASAINWLRASDSLFHATGLRRLVEANLKFERLELAMAPLHVVATDLSGQSVVLSTGPAVDAILASAAIPAVFPAVSIGEMTLMDGAVCGNTPILSAVELGARRLVVLPTGYACALSRPPKGALGRGFHALTLLIVQQMMRDLSLVSRHIEVVTVPSLCPLDVSPFDFTQTETLIGRAATQTQDWIDSGGLGRRGGAEVLAINSH